MGLFKQNLPAPIGGVSQVPAETRGPGYADDLINSIITALGLSPRQGTSHLSTISDVDQDSVHIAKLAPSDDEEYVAIIDRLGVQVVDTQTGNEKTVTLASGSSEFLAGGKFSSAAIDNDLFVASRGQSKAQLTGDPVPVQKNGALVTVVSGRPSALYRVTLDGISIDVRTPDDPPPPVKRPAIGLSVSTGDVPAIQTNLFPLSLTLKQATTASVQINITRNNYTGGIQLAATSPEGLTVNISSPTLGSGSSSTTMTVSAASTLAAGAYTITVIATGTNVPQSSASIVINVQDAGTGGDPGDTGGTPTPSYFNIAPIGNQVSIEQGSFGSAVWNITRQPGFTADVTAQLVTNVAGISMAVSGAGNPDTQVFTTFTVDASVLPGSHSFSVRFVGAGSADVFGTMTVNVTSNSAPASFAFDANNESTVVANGGLVTGSQPITIDRIGGFAGDITITGNWTGPVSGLAFDPATLVDDGSGYAVFNIDWDLTGQPSGNYQINYKASADGQPDAFGSLVIAFTAE